MDARKVRKCVGHYFHVKVVIAQRDFVQQLSSSQDVLLAPSACFLAEEVRDTSQKSFRFQSIFFHVCNIVGNLWSTADLHNHFHIIYVSPDRQQPRYDGASCTVLLAAVPYTRVEEASNVNTGPGSRNRKLERGFGDCNMSCKTSTGLPGLGHFSAAVRIFFCFSLQVMGVWKSFLHILLGLNGVCWLEAFIVLYFCFAV